MEIKNYEEQVNVKDIVANKITYYASFNNTEFYENLEDCRLEKNIRLEFLKLIKDKIQDQGIAFILNIKVGNSSVQKYFGIWEKLKKDDIIFRNKKTEKEKGEWISGIAFPNEKEFIHMFRPYNWLVIIGNLDKINELYENYSFDLNKLTKQSLVNGCTIVEYIDIGVDGKILSFIEK